MAGELWAGRTQIGLETTPGTLVPATRIMYLRDPVLDVAREARPKKFATGTRDNVRDMRLGPHVVSGKFSVPLSASEILEWLLIGIKGGVTPTTPGGATLSRLWTFVPGALASATLEWFDGARGWVGSGMRANGLTLAGNVHDENVLTVDLFGTQLAAQALTASLTDRTPDYIEGWESKLYIDNTGTAFGTTVIAGTLLSWSVQIGNNLGRKYFADNTLAAGAVIAGEIDISASLVFEASAAQALTAFNNWDAVTRRNVRLEFGNNELIETTLKKFVTVDIPGYWTVVNLGGNADGTRTYELTLNYTYDVTNAFGIQIRAQNARTAAWT
jgi:hypothetical protein